MFAAGVFDDDRSSVVCLSAGKLLDLLVDHACAVREDSLGLLAHEEAGHIEVVDGHVLEDTPAALHVAEWRWSWVARAELGNNRAADLVVGDSLAHTRKVRVKAALQGGHELDVGDLACVDGLDRLRKIRRDRLLAEDVLARRGARLDLISVEARRRADPNSLDVRVVDHLHVVARPIRHVELLRGRLGLADRRVRDDDGAGVRARRERLEVHDADAASADHTYADRAFAHNKRRRRRRAARHCAAIGVLRRGEQVVGWRDDGVAR
mmetsp:Transcript_43155/g.116585  ORF Transcript_43155/g.116585 Transcript_43155/m.116585 type:complete len:266 (+) Transcript_43155:1035-1832(+)